MRIQRAALAALGLLLTASPAAAQHCWPSMIALLVRDAQGAVVDPGPLMDSLQYSPGRREAADFVVRRALVHPRDANAFDQPGGTPAIVWYGQGDCRVDMREVVLRAPGVVMRLWMDLHIDTQRRPGPSSYLLEVPPLANGTWRLDVCALPEGTNSGYAPIPQGWVRVSERGDPGTPPQAPAGCAAGGGL